MAPTKRRDPDTDELLGLAAAGDDDARQRLLQRHRDRLVRMVAVRLDRRLAGRLDPSDVVQEALADADRKLAAYLRDSAAALLPLAPSAGLETAAETGAAPPAFREAQRPPRGAGGVARRLGSGTGRAAARFPVRAERLAAAPGSAGARPGRAAPVARARPRSTGAAHLEELSIRKVAEVLGVTEGAAKVRHLRALERLSGLLDDDLKGDRS